MCSLSQGIIDVCTHAANQSKELSMQYERNAEYTYIPDRWVKNTVKAGNVRLVIEYDQKTWFLSTLGCFMRLFEYN